MTASQPGAEGLPSEAPGKHGIRDRARRGAELAKAKYSGSFAEHLWSRLGSLDFINRGMLLAAILLLCFFPFLIVANALAGHSAVTGLARRLGLDREAASRRNAVDPEAAPQNDTSSTFAAGPNGGVCVCPRCATATLSESVP
jgi:hypothetical protein